MYPNPEADGKLLSDNPNHVKPYDLADRSRRRALQDEGDEEGRIIYFARDVVGAKLSTSRRILDQRKTPCSKDR